MEHVVLATSERFLDLSWDYNMDIVLRTDSASVARETASAIGGLVMPVDVFVERFKRARSRRVMRVCGIIGEAAACLLASLEINGLIFSEYENEDVFNACLAWASLGVNDPFGTTRRECLFEYNESGKMTIEAREVLDTYQNSAPSYAVCSERGDRGWKPAISLEDLRTRVK